MATKPTAVPTWSTDGGTDGVSGQANNLEPPASKKASGWHYLEKFPRNWLNYWMNLVFQWCDYLNDQDFAGDLNIQNDLSVDNDLAVDNNATVTGTLNVTGTTTCGELVTTDPAVFHGTVTKNIALSQGNSYTSDGGPWSFGFSNWNSSSTGNDSVCFPIDLKSGAEVSAVRIRCNGASGSNIKMYLYKMNDSGATEIANVSSAFADTSKQDLEITGLSQSVLDLSTTFTQLIVNCETISGGAGARGIYGLEVEYSFPGP